MHEYPITQEILRIAEETGKQNKASRITKISLVVGELSGFIGDSITLYFDILSKGTLAEGAEISIRTIKPQLQCTQCGKFFERKRHHFECPDCGSPGKPTDIGKEFYVENIEIEAE